MIFSGVQPSGCSLHIGNYLGAVKRWVDLQKQDLCFFCVVDLHAITSEEGKNSNIRSNSFSLLATYLACGIDPNKSSVFLQSSVPEHAELCWLLGCLTPVGWLSRMTQYKDKSQNNRHGITMGLFCYPVLMAADILLYGADLVPVGNDQKQHLELAQDIAKAFNARYGVDYFRIPHALSFDTCARVMSLKNGTKKMSKSDPSDFSRINLFDDDDVIAQKIRKATTDCRTGFNYEEICDRPELYNLVSIFSALGDLSIKEVCAKFENSSTKEFKDELTGLLIDKIAPIRMKGHDLLQDMEYLNSVLSSGNERAREVAFKNIKDVKRIMGLEVL